jgi:type I restriction enzyme S subunit
MSGRNEDKFGYKKTRVGWIPEEWDAIPLGSAIRRSEYGLSVRPSEGGTTPLLRMGNIGEGRITYNNLAYVELPDNALAKYSVHKDDLLFNRTNSLEHVGKVGIVDNPRPAVFASYLVRFKLRTSVCFPPFANYFFDSAQSRNRLQSLATPGVCQYNINQSELQRQFILPLPPLPEQKKIAEILSTWDEAIEQTRALVDAKKKRKQALMQQLLTGTSRLPGFKGPWEKYHLGDLFEERKEFNVGHLPLLAITGRRGVVPALEIERKDSSSGDKSKHKYIVPDDIGYNTMRMWQGVSAVSDLEGIVSPAYTICIPKKEINVRFMGYLFKLPAMIHLFWRYSQGLVSDTLNLTFHNFAQIAVNVASLDEQGAIAAVLETADDEVAVLKEKLIALEKQKRGLMQKLVTGELRVKV